MRIILIFIFSALMYSCKEKEKVPANLIPKEKMENVFWDFLRAETFSVEFLRNDSLRKDDTLQNLELQKKIFAFYGVSRNQFYDSYHYYADHPEIMIAIIDSMLANQERLKPKNGLSEFY